MVFDLFSNCQPEPKLVVFLLVVYLHDIIHKKCRKTSIVEIKHSLHKFCEAQYINSDRFDEKNIITKIKLLFK
ncbi:hypothetical protein Hanom_Chr08g00752201 [Helianthus anomalus]